MTAREAYINGFCKVAEAHGIDPKALYKFAKDSDRSHAFAVAGGGLGGLGGLLFGDLARHGFKGTAILNKVRPVYDRPSYRLGSAIRRALAGDSRPKLRKLMGSGKGKAIAAALVGVPTLAGLAGGAGIGNAIDRLFDKK